MSEKRTASRIPLDHSVPLVIEDEAIDGLLVNLSTTGALFSFHGDERDKVDPTVLGLDGSFTIKPKGKPARLYTGELVRYFVRDDVPYVALRFWNKYTEQAE
ncbi:MAG: PilZ domain-containing protein [Spirochaetia bacterium]